MAGLQQRHATSSHGEQQPGAAAPSSLSRHSPLLPLYFSPLLVSSSPSSSFPFFFLQGSSPTTVTAAPTTPASSHSDQQLWRNAGRTAARTYNNDSGQQLDAILTCTGSFKALAHSRRIFTDPSRLVSGLVFHYRYLICLMYACFR